MNGVSENDDFDSSGNLVSIGAGTSLTYASNRLQTMTAGGQTTYFFFDTSKRWRTVQAPTNSQSDPNRTAFTYTSTGRLATFAKYKSGTASLTGTYTHDASGQRTKSVVALTGGLTTTTDFVYEGLNLMSLSASQTGTGATSWRITYLYDDYGRPYAGIYRNPGTSTTPVVFGLVTTDRGDVVELLDAAGTPFAAYRYDAWGNPQGTGNVGTGIWSQSTALITSSLATDIAKRQVLRYASYCFDSESGMYYLSARHYNPVTRQFLSKDPAKDDGEASAYQYCAGDPVGNADPSGCASHSARYWWRLRPQDTGTYIHLSWTYSESQGVYNLKNPKPANPSGGRKHWEYLTSVIKTERKWKNANGGYNQIRIRYRIICSAKWYNFWDSSPAVFSMYAYVQIDKDSVWFWQHYKVAGTNFIL